MKRAIRTVPALVFVAVLVFSISPELAARQRAQPFAPPSGLLATLNQEAGPSDAAGIHVYSQHLIELLVPQRAGKPYIRSLADRLAAAEQMARHGKRKLVSDADIRKAFNDLMRQTGAPASLRANLSDVELARTGFARQLPVMISRQKNGTYCEPGEAVWVLEVLIENVGTPPTPLSSSGPSVVGPAMPPARTHLLQYYASHSRTEITRLFNQLAKTLEI